ncbi:hypothetical protein AU476_36345 [Cupriavidus sp. UYMSc13B]|nr:hypothetical protein AU476_36345 [Cupriavidus sp. UYMSc13B]
MLGGQDVTVNVASMSNAGGAVRANQDVSAKGAIAGSGEMTAGRDLSLDVAGDYLNDAANHLKADGNLRVAASGTLTNTGALAAAGNLTVAGTNVINATGGGMNGTMTTVQAANAITNAGRIEGDTVQTTSTTLDNTGTVIGNTVQVQATDLTNTGASRSSPPRRTSRSTRPTRCQTSMARRCTARATCRLPATARVTPAACSPIRSIP